MKKLDHTCGFDDVAFDRHLRPVSTEQGTTTQQNTEAPIPSEKTVPVTTTVPTVTQETTGGSTVTSEFWTGNY